MSARETDARRAARPGLGVGPIGIHLRRRAAWCAAGLVALLVVLIGWSTFTGTIDLPASRVWATLTGSGDSIEELVVLDHRFGRAVVAVLVGFALGCAGGLTQSITRNPIASPDILGVTAGAAATATLILTQPGLIDDPTQASSILAPAALLGGLATTGLILAIGWRGGFSGVRLILVGIAVNALAGAVTTWLLTRAELDTAAVAARWLVGSLDAARYDDLAVLLPVIGLALGAVLILSRDVGALRLGRDVAGALGTPPIRTEALALLVAVGLAAVTTAYVGPISFVAFVAPQAAMRLFGTAGPPPIAGGLLGAALLLAADLVSANLPTPLPVGIVTAVVGAPFLLYLVIRHTRRTSV
ncbi:iron complex transport system permease protein [Mumia flava]|uniref:Iron complex transport system permease protein n=1 Tax=Mumia flava TaxID=1348852 RepID=A0A0B2BDU9_9ACTN|nr:iron ABC transporter permease [Mumia flava]PJJ53730.1 iron complex transport system permease protein [Mumia flava]